MRACAFPGHPFHPHSDRGLCRARVRRATKRRGVVRIGESSRTGPDREKDFRRHRCGLVLVVDISSSSYIFVPNGTRVLLHEWYCSNLWRQKIAFIFTIFCPIMLFIVHTISTPYVWSTHILTTNKIIIVIELYYKFKRYSVHVLERNGL